MRSILIVSRKKELGEALVQLVRPLRFDKVDLTDSAQDARRRVQRKDYNLVMINSPLSHEFGTELALDIVGADDGPDVILLAKGETLSAVEHKLLNAPVFVVQKPINKQLILRDMQFMLNSQQKRERLLKQNNKLKRKIEDLQVVFRAKLVLMEHLGMSEEEAHRYIQKKSMDERRTPGEVSQALVNFYKDK